MKTRSRTIGILWTIVTLLGLSAPLEAQGLLNQVRFEEFAGGLDMPVSIAHAGDGSGRLFIVQQRGRIYVHDGERLLDTPFLDITSRVSESGFERGLLGLVFHPDYEQNGFFYVNYTTRARPSQGLGNGDTVIARYQVSRANPNVTPADSEAILLTQEQPFSNHNAGDLHFGPDGYLYFGLGDGGVNPDSPGHPAQDLSELLGKMLRVDVDGDFPYAIPPSNPFAGQQGNPSQGAARPEIWAYGFRNPWRFSFDRETGDMFIGDVGQSDREEINFQPASSTGGENYGWNRMEGDQCYPPGGQNCIDGTLTLPILTYETGGNCSITGGYRYRGLQYPQLNGIYIYGDFCSGRIWVATQQGAAWTVADTRDTSFSISTFGEDEAGEIYVADHDGVVYRIVADHPAPAVSSIQPDSAPVGSGAFTLMVRGSNFVPGAQVLWNGAARSTTFVDNGVLQAEIPASDIATQGAAQVTVNNPAPGGGASASLQFVVEAGVPMMPTINEGGVVNAASFAAGNGVSPGSIVSVFGVDLAVDERPAGELPLPKTLNGTTLRFNGVLAAPQFYQHPLQMNIQAPWELEGQAEATLQAEVAGQTSAEVAVALATYNPGLFSVPPGADQGAILISGTPLLAAAENAVAEAPSRPARRGEYLEIFGTGLGPVNDRPASGAAATANPISHALTLPTVTIGGVQALVVFAGLAPDFVGLYQVNVEVPAGAPSGGAVAVVVSIGGVVANTVTIAVE